MKFEKLEYPEKSVCKLTFSATPEELEAGAQAVYERTRDTYTIKGFEKGQAERADIEAERGEHVFWYDAINDIMDRDVGELLDKALADNGLTAIDEPSYDLVSVKKDEGFVATATVSLKPELTLGEYKGLKQTVAAVEVADKEIDAVLERRQRENAELVPHNGPAVKGNTVTVDYHGTIDGKPFAGSDAENRQVVLGRGLLIEGLETAIIGHKADDAFDCTVTFPKYYRAAPEAAGKEAAYHVVLHKVCVSQLPALNCDFAQKVGKVDTMDAYRAKIRGELYESKHAAAINRARGALMDQLADLITGDIPTPLIDHEYDNQMRQLQFMLQMQGATLAMFLKQVKKSNEELQEMLRTRSARNVRINLGLSLIAETEKLGPSDEELQAEIASRAEKRKKTVEEFLKENDTAKIRTGMQRQRATDFVMSHAEIRDDNHAPEAPAAPQADKPADPQ